MRVSEEETEPRGLISYTPRWIVYTTVVKFIHILVQF